MVGLVWYEISCFSFAVFNYLLVTVYLNLELILLLKYGTCFRFMGAAALQKYIGSLGGIGASGVGSSSSYSPKELNKEVIPEKVEYCDIYDCFYN